MSNDTLSISIEATRVVLVGAIDETSDLTPLDQIDGDVVLDLAGVSRINSIGVHHWIRKIVELSGRHEVVIEACSYPVVFQANVVSNFFGAASVRSAMAPYFCSSCSKGATMLITAEEVQGADDGAPNKLCPDCSTEMDFDELDSYFGFFKGSETGRRG